jgi:hypothetical protein
VTFDCVVRIDLDLHADLLPDYLINDVSASQIAAAKSTEPGYRPAFASGG